MLQIICNFLVPGLGTLFMKKPFIGAVQLCVLLVAFVLTVSVFLTFFGLVLWLVDVLWALVIGVRWRAKRKPREAP
jgi:hypothetical protein